MTRYALYGGWKGDTVNPKTLIGLYKSRAIIYRVLEESFDDMGAMDWFHIESRHEKVTEPEPVAWICGHKGTEYATLDIMVATDFAMHGHPVTPLYAHPSEGRPKIKNI